jgi:hypothetical protein
VTRIERRLSRLRRCTIRVLDAVRDAVEAERNPILAQRRCEVLLRHAEQLGELYADLVYLRLRASEKWQFGTDPSPKSRGQR